MYGGAARIYDRAVLSTRTLGGQPAGTPMREERYMWDDPGATVRRQRRAAGSAATRYLCVGAQIDEQFAGRAIYELLTERQRASAPSYGIDAVPVLLHCLWATRRHRIRDVILSVMLAVDVAIWFVTLRSPLQSVSLFTTSRSIWSSESMRRLAFLAGSVVVLISVASVVRMIDWAWGRIVIGHTLVKERFNPESARVSLLPWTSRRLSAIGRQQYGCLTVYDASSPSLFVGAGPEIADVEWHFALDLRRKTDADSPPGRLGNAGTGEAAAITPLELYRHIELRLLELRDPSMGHAYLLPDLEVSDHLFVSGLTRKDGVPLLDQAEGNQLTSAEMNRIADVPDGLIRHFKSIRVESWGGELVVTAFLHLATQGSTLYAEFTPCLLPPIRPLYHVLDTQPMPSADEWLRVVAGAIWGAPSALVTAPTRLLPGGRPPDVLATDHRSSNPSLDRGARTSVRLLGATPRPDHHFQWLDARKYLRVIEVQVLDALVEFLDCKGIDTSDVRARQSTILNKGIIVQNSTLQDVAMVAGDGGNATVDRGSAAGPATAV